MIRHPLIDADEQAGVAGRRWQTQLLLLACLLSEKKEGNPDAAEG